jgi:SAM-dependent methyltransferase
VYEVHGFPILHCKGCAHRFTPVEDGAKHVAEVYSDTYFTEGGAGYSDYLAERSILTETGRHYGEMLKEYAAPGLVLDVGSAAGFILKGLTEAGWHGFGIEPNERMATYAREHVGVDIHVGTLEDTTLVEPVDLVTMVQVVGHFFDLHRAFEAATQMTRMGGLWLIEAWDYGSMAARVLGRHWHAYAPPSVVQWFTRDGLARAVARFGFREVGRGLPRKRIALSHAKSALATRAPRVAALVPDSDTTLPYPPLDVFYGVYRRTHAAQ